VVGPAALQDDWAIANAIEAGAGGRGAASARADARRRCAAGKKILGQLAWLVRSKFPAIAAGDVRGAIDAVFRTDLDLKRSAGDARVLLERLVVELSAGSGDQRVAGGDGRVMPEAARRVVSRDL